jgi:riboflavin biosynthesis pyrimidine reductase
MLQEVFPSPGTLHDFENQASNSLGILYPKIEGLRLNYVVSPKVTSQESNLASNELDRTLLRHIRSQSDLIVTSGETARRENLRSSKYAPMLILTKSEDKYEIPAVQFESAQSVYLTQKLGTSYRNSKALAIGISNAPVSEFLPAFCKANAFKSPLLETGITLASEFVKSGALAEVALTVTMADKQSDAEQAATKFLSTIGAGEFTLLQLLNNEETWLFRFGAE